VCVVAGGRGPGRAGFRPAKGTTRASAGAATAAAAPPPIQSHWRDCRGAGAGRDTAGRTGDSTVSEAKVRAAKSSEPTEAVAVPLANGSSATADSRIEA